MIEQVFPQKRLLPGTLIAPKFSKNPAVYAVMVAKVQAINGLFKAMTVADIDDTSATVYTDAPAWKNTNSYTDPRAIVTYGKVKLGNDAYHLSTQLASLMVLTDVTNDDVPYVSPSNKSLKMDSYTINGAEAFLTPEQANYLNGEGITTALNFIGGWKAWGNRTAAFPANTDVKDNFIPIRRMFNWVSNSLILSHYSKVDNPLNRRQIDAVIDSANIWFNGLAAREQILGGRVEFLESENPDKDISLYINSPGGMVSAGMAIYDTMNFIKPDVSTLCTGMAASMGAFLLAAGAKGKRFSLPNSKVMIHQPLGGTRGQATEIEIHAREILKTRDQLNRILAERTGQPLEKIERDTERDYYLSADESKEYGLIDQVISKRG